jgi:hypothetical protein
MARNDYIASCPACLQEQLLQREHRKESVRLRKQEREMQIKAGLRPAPGAAAAAAAAASAADAAAGLPPEEEEAIVSKGHIISYCALDYPRIVDSVRLRLHDIKAQLKVSCPTQHQLHSCFAQPLTTAQLFCCRALAQLFCCRALAQLFCCRAQLYKEPFEEPDPVDKSCLLTR